MRVKLELAFWIVLIAAVSFFAATQIARTASSSELCAENPTVTQHVNGGIIVTKSAHCEGS